jgi:hypothetical protein
MCFKSGASRLRVVQVLHLVVVLAPIHRSSLNRKTHILRAAD